MHFVLYLNISIKDAILTMGVILMGDRFKMLEELGIQKCKLYLSIDIYMFVIFVIINSIHMHTVH